MDKMIAYCGLDCFQCPGYIATQANDLPALERLVLQAREEFGVATASLESVMCDGCLSASTRLCGYCNECPVRACGRTRAVENCAHCPDYGCEKLESFFAQVPAVRVTLDAIHQALGA